MQDWQIPKLGESDNTGFDPADIERVKVPSGKELHRFPTPEHTSTMLVIWTTDELTSLCPVTGHPDFCSLTVIFEPEVWCTEMKSEKYYIESFRNEGHFYEKLISVIYTDFLFALETESLVVRGQFNIRGGMPQTVILGDASLLFGLGD